MSPERFDDADHQLGVRQIDGEPFDHIMAALDNLPEDESLLLINSFEPEPLYEVLEDRGFDFETVNPTSGEWHVRIVHA